MQTRAALSVRCTVDRPGRHGPSTRDAGAPAPYPPRALDNPVPMLRRVAFAEGVSFLVLLGIAMPLKYVGGMPLAVSICGSLHGVLFLWLMALVWQTGKVGWTGRQKGLIVLASLLPFGPFVVDRRIPSWPGGAG